MAITSYDEIWQVPSVAFLIHPVCMSSCESLLSIEAEGIHVTHNCIIVIVEYYGPSQDEADTRITARLVRSPVKSMHQYITH
jgi:hypothetical protein